MSDLQEHGWDICVDVGANVPTDVSARNSAPVSEHTWVTVHKRKQLHTVYSE